MIAHSAARPATVTEKIPGSTHLDREFMMASDV